MIVRIHPHARDRMIERGADEDEIRSTLERGERYPAKFGRTGFRRNFPFKKDRRGKFYETKQIELYAIEEQGGWLVITVLTRFF
ncbi:MAG: DUF4258 domain-containing protein [Desulfobacterales bacterium]